MNKKYRVTFKGSRNEFYCYADEMEISKSKHLIYSNEEDETYSVARFDEPIDKIEVVEEEFPSRANDVIDAINTAKNKKNEEAESSWEKDYETIKKSDNPVSREEFDSFRNDMIDFLGNLETRGVTEEVLWICLKDKHYKKDI